MKYFNHLFALTVVASLLAAGCSAAPPAADDLGTQVASTLQSMATLTAGAPTATQPATATEPAPTATDTSAPTNTPAAGEVQLATGATQAVVTGHVDANQTKTYKAGAAANQILIAQLTTPNSSAVMEIVGADGAVLLPKSNQWTSFRSLLPKTQEYEIRVIGGSSGQDFTLVLTFAVPVTFASGEDSRSYSGSTVNGFPVTYALYAQKNQELEVEVNTNPDDAALTVWGFNDGNPYARAQNGVTDFSLDLPSTQYYIIEVVPQGGRIIDYSVEISVK